MPSERAKQAKQAKRTKRAKRSRPLDPVSLNEIPPDLTYWRRRPNVTRTNAVAGTPTRVKLPRQPYNARQLMEMIARGQTFFPNNRQPMRTHQQNTIKLITEVPRRCRGQYRKTRKRKTELETGLKLAEIGRKWNYYTNNENTICKGTRANGTEFHSPIRFSSFLKPNDPRLSSKRLLQDKRIHNLRESLRNIDNRLKSLRRPPLQ